MAKKGKIMFTQSSIAILLLLTLFGCKEPSIQASSRGSLQGEVIENVADTPIQGVTITTKPGSSRSTTTNEGLFSIKEVEVGNYTVYAFKEDFRISAVNIQVLEGADTNVEFTLEALERPEGSIAGTIYNNDGNTLSQAAVSTDPGSGIAITDLNGEYVLEAVHVGEYTLVVTKLGYISSNHKLTVNAGQTAMGSMTLTSIEENPSH